MLNWRPIVRLLRTPRRSVILLAACVGAALMGPLVRAASEALGPWIATGGDTQLMFIGMLFGVYLGLTAASRGGFLVSRATATDLLVFRAAVVGLHVGAVGASAWAGVATAQGGGPMSTSAWLWGTALVTSLACALEPHVRSPGRCLLATVALLWWIPAVLPPSFLRAVPRGLRELAAGGPERAHPGEPVAWLADTALVVGLLLLAWAPRRATRRGHEVRHPG